MGCATTARAPRLPCATAPPHLPAQEIVLHQPHLGHVWQHDPRLYRARERAELPRQPPSAVPPQPCWLRSHRGQPAPPVPPPPWARRGRWGAAASGARLLGDRAPSKVGAPRAQAPACRGLGKSAASETKRALSVRLHATPPRPTVHEPSPPPLTHPPRPIAPPPSPLGPLAAIPALPRCDTTAGGGGARAVPRDG